MSKIKINSSSYTSSPVKSIINNKTVKKSLSETKTPVFDVSTEECGYFLFKGKVIPIMFPR